MTASHVLLRMALAVMLLAAGAQVAFGWPGLSHVLITQEASYDNLRFYANLPDTYPSMVEAMPSRFFAWTHIRLTVTAWGAPIEAVEDPAYDMWILATKKLEGLSGQELDVARKTALGWRVNEVADLSDLEEPLGPSKIVAEENDYTLKIEAVRKKDTSQIQRLEFGELVVDYGF